MNHNEKDKRKKLLKHRAKSITLEILEGLFNHIEDVGELIFSRKAAFTSLNSYNYLNKKYEWTESKLGVWINSLQQQDYIRITKDNKIASIEFTNKGKIKIIEAISSKRKEDNSIRYLSFDIPEKLKYKRDCFRKAIKQIGFKQVQQSLWAINKDVGDLVQIAEYEYGVERFVAYIISSSSDIEGVVQKLFE